MLTEHWALLVSVLALLVSIGVPIWQSRETSAQAIAARRSLLLQTILDTKTTTYVASHELLALLQRHADQMDESQKTSLPAMYPRMREHCAELENLHETWADFSDGSTLAEIEEALVSVSVAAAEARETAQLIEASRKSYE